MNQNFCLIFWQLTEIIILNVTPNCLLEFLFIHIRHSTSVTSYFTHRYVIACFIYIYIYIYIYDGYIIWRILTVFINFLCKFKKKTAQHRKVLEQINLFRITSTTINTSRPIYRSVPLFDENHILKLLVSAGTQNYCCMTLWIYPKYLQI